MNNMKRLDVYKLESTPSNRKRISTRLVFCDKRDETEKNSLKREMGNQGFHAGTWISYDITHVPVSKLTTVRV